MQNLHTCPLIIVNSPLSTSGLYFDSSKGSMSYELFLSFNNLLSLLSAYRERFFHFQYFVLLKHITHEVYLITQNMIKH